MTHTQIGFLITYLVGALVTMGSTAYKMFKDGLASGWRPDSAHAKLQAVGTSVNAFMVGAFWPLTMTFEGVLLLLKKLKK